MSVLFPIFQGEIAAKQSKKRCLLEDVKSYVPELSLDLSHMGSYQSKPCPPLPEYFHFLVWTRIKSQQQPLV